MESTLIPALGTALLVCTILLIGLSAPFAFREAYLRAQQTGGSFSNETLQRVESHLALAGLENQETLAYLASTAGLEAGQAVLLGECVTCHDLRTVLARPRTPENWHQTVKRMADRSTLLAPSKSRPRSRPPRKLRVRKKPRRRPPPRSTPSRHGNSMRHVAPCATRSRSSKPCPPKSDAEARALVSRMVSNGMPATEEELVQIIDHLNRAFVSGG